MARKTTIGMGGMGKWTVAAGFVTLRSVRRTRRDGQLSALPRRTPVRERKRAEDGGDLIRSPKNTEGGGEEVRPSCLHETRERLHCGIE